MAPSSGLGMAMNPCIHFGRFDEQPPKQISSGEAESNMEYREMTYTSVTVGTLKSRSGGPVATTYEVTVPFLTNTVDIPSQAELLLEVEEKGVKPKGKNRTWK